MKQNLNIITLGVRSLENTMKFYKDGLGWKPSEKSQGDIVFFNMNGLILSFYPRELLAEDAGVELNTAGRSMFSFAYNTKSEAEVDEILKKVENLGAKIAKKAAKVFWGGYSGYFEDPDGYLWEVAFNPFVEFDEQGNLIM